MRGLDLLLLLFGQLLLPMLGRTQSLYLSNCPLGNFFWDSLSAVSKPIFATENRWKALEEIDQIQIPMHLFDLKISANIRHEYW